ncbi:MAG: amidohydrolase family protein [Candidatus Altiarchaeales archaeon]|nr:amidohydrolase family protein [Candidatus Altiarchaeales archaeon]
MVGGVLDLTVGNAGLPDGGASDFIFSKGLISKKGKISSKGGIDADGMLVHPGFVNVHTHLDKADLLSRMKPNQFGKSLEENRELLKSFKRNYSESEVVERAGRVLTEMIVQGCTAVRTQVDVDTTAGLTALNALVKLKEKFSNLVELQLCAFPQEGVLSEEKQDLLERALEKGADLLGGLPLVEKTVEERKKHIDVLFEIARKHDKDLEVQIDESNNPDDFMLPYLVEKTLEEKYKGRVSATHCISLSRVDDNTALKTIQGLKKARMNVIVTPSANLITRFPEKAGRPGNSLTRVKELLQNGINVALGTDNIRDLFFPLGNCSMLREMHVLITATRMTEASDFERVFNMASVNGAKIMGLGYGVEVGRKADLIVCNGKNQREVLNGFPSVRYVIKDGVIVASTRVLNENRGVLE